MLAYWAQRCISGSLQISLTNSQYLLVRPCVYYSTLTRDGSKHSHCHVLSTNQTGFAIRSIKNLYFQTRRLNQQQHIDKELGKLLYIGKDKQRLRNALGTFYALSAVVAAASPYLFNLVSSSTIGTIFIGIQVFTFVVINPFLFYQFGKRYVSELYHDSEKDSYTAILLSPTVFANKKLVFTPKDCKMPATPSVFTSFYVDKNPLFINSDVMEYQEYMKMLRYASDLDYENPDRQEHYRQTIESAVKEKQKEQK